MAVVGMDVLAYTRLAQPGNGSQEEGNLNTSQRNSPRFGKVPWLGLVLVLLSLVILGVACGSSTDTEGPDDGTAVKLAPASALSPDLRQLPPAYQEAYRFALANPDILTKIPCYCGCGSVGHMNNRMCYIQSESADGKVVFDYHGAG